MVTSPSVTWKPSVEKGILNSANHPSSLREVATSQYEFQSAFIGGPPANSPSFGFRVVHAPGDVQVAVVVAEPDLGTLRERSLKGGRVHGHLERGDIGPGRFVHHAVQFDRAGEAGDGDGLAG